MRIAILTDIHANLIAFASVADHVERWKPDHVLLAGDLINRGPRPLECLRLFQEKATSQAWRTIRGNHEDYVLMFARPDAPVSGPRFEVHKPSYWTYTHVQPMLNVVQTMPESYKLTDLFGHEVRMVHASMLGNREGIYPETTEAEMGARLGDGSGILPAALCVGHTHRPLIRRYRDTLVVNAGSSGLPFDGDVRPSYARLTWRRNRWNAEIVRVNYDHRAALRDFDQSGYAEEAGPLTRLVRIELTSARSMLYSWAVQFQSLAESGQITMRQSVEEFLNQ
jgi:predicted phosphodiesterase